METGIIDSERDNFDESNIRSHSDNDTETNEWQNVTVWDSGPVNKCSFVNNDVWPVLPSSFDSSTSIKYFS